MSDSNKSAQLQKHTFKSILKCLESSKKALDKVLDTDRLPQSLAPDQGLHFLQ